MRDQLSAFQDCRLMSSDRFLTILQRFSMLPLITSPETTTVMEWINADEERHRHWREQAERSLAATSGLIGSVIIQFSLWALPLER